MREQDAHSEVVPVKLLEFGKHYQLVVFDFRYACLCLSELAR